MSSMIGDWLDNEVYPVLFAGADHYFPEFGFRRLGGGNGGWVSTTTLKADGSQGTQKGKVYLYENTKHCLKDYRLDKPVSLWRYLADREGLQENKDIAQYLADVSGIPLPERPTCAGNTERRKPKPHVHPAVLQAAQDYMQGCLQWAEEAAQGRAYLQQRGYTPEDVSAMQLGFLPSQQCLKEHLLTQGHSPACVKFLMGKLQAARHGKDAPPIGTSHQLALPCFGARQRLEGFTFRTLDSQQQGDKYLNMAGLKKSVALLDFPVGTKDLTIVEGVFDAKLAKARGCDAVVPLNGTHLNAEQVGQIAAQGVTQLTLCLDNDAAGKKATFNIVQKLLQQCPDMRLFVAQLPDGIDDPDELISAVGIDVFQQVTDTAINAGQYLADAVLKPRLRHYDMDNIPSKERDAMFAYCQGMAEKLNHPRDIHDYITSMGEVLPAMAYVQRAVNESALL